MLSYLRLFALGLASIKLAEAFNSLAASSFAFKGVGVLLGLLILLIGHTINFCDGHHERRRARPAPQRDRVLQLEPPEEGEGISRLCEEGKAEE